jgi:hypothetical protein
MELRGDRLVEVIEGIEILSPPMPPKSEFLNWEVKKKADQVFPFTEVPRNLKKQPKEEREAFIRREWKRRIEGVWFYNNGQPTYITGLHYYYLNYYKIDAPIEYRDSDRKYFWFWDYCEKDPNCYGMLYIARRREGKTYRAGVINLEFITRTPQANAGIQSKTGSDASKVFQKTIVNPWRKLPYFFSPMTDGTTNPKRTLRFYAPSVRGKSAKTEDGSVYTEAELESEIDFMAAEVMAYDGAKLFRYIHDEIGKTTEVDICKRWDVVRPCLETNKGIHGKSIHTSTVEEMEKEGGKACYELWQNSEQFGEEHKKLGRTPSGLYRYFSPAWEGWIVDKYGMTMEEESKADIKRRFFDPVANNPQALLGIKRKFPFTPGDAFRSNGDKCHFNAFNINQRLEAIDSMKHLPYKKYDLTWYIDTDGLKKVKTVDNPTNGRFDIAWLPTDPKELNQVKYMGTITTPSGATVDRYKPLNERKFVIGVDPYDKRFVTNEGKQSNAAAYAFRKFDYNNEMQEGSKGYFPSNTFIVQYINRPPTPSMFYEDMMMLAHLLGCEVHFENQRSNIANHFEENGYGDFLMERPKFTHTHNTQSQEAKGTPSSTLVIEMYTELIMEYVQKYCHTVPFKELLEDWLDFDMTDTQKYDPTVASGFTLIGTKKAYKAAPKQINVEDIFRRY